MWKHLALFAWLTRARSLQPAVRFIDTHAGAGSYALGPTGEWTEGLGLLRKAVELPPLVSAYLARAAASEKYPGSPLFALSILDRPDDRFILHELDPSVHAELARNVVDPRATIHSTDGLEAIIDRDAHVLIDPSYQDRKEWELVVPLIARSSSSSVMLWYPIKSYARPNAMHARLEKAGIAATALELLTAPLDSKKNRLNGSGVLFVHPPAGLIEELAALAAWLGPHLALPIPPHDAWWSLRVVGFGR